MASITGHVRFASAAPSAVATVRVRVEDVTELDAPAVVVGEQVVPGVHLPPAAPVPFAVTAELDPRRRYTVRAHVDLTGDGRVTPDDFVSMQAYPVTGDDGPVVVDVRAVG